MVANMPDCKVCGFGTHEVSTACLACTTHSGGKLMGCNSTDNAVCQSYPEAVFALGPVPLAGRAVLEFVKLNSVPILLYIRWIFVFKLELTVISSNLLF